MSIRQDTVESLRLTELVDREICSVLPACQAAPCPHTSRLVITVPKVSQCKTEGQQKQL